MVALGNSFVASGNNFVAIGSYLLISKFLRCSDSLSYRGNQKLSLVKQISIKQASQSNSNRCFCAVKIISYHFFTFRFLFGIVF